MKREYYGEDRIPRAVYFQCVWILKDIPRLEAISEIWRLQEEPEEGETVYYQLDDGMTFKLGTAAEAVYKLECIADALEIVPEEYRKSIMDNIIHQKRLGDYAHDNTWKKWKHRFIHRLSRNLNLC